MIFGHKPFTTNNTYSACACRSSLILIVVSLSEHATSQGHIIQLTDKAENYSIK
jgi:hypothetical protein